MRGDIQILPPDRTTVSYDLLAQLVANYLLTHSPDVDISSALVGKRPKLAQMIEEEDDEGLANFLQASISKRSMKEGTQVLKSTKGKTKMTKGEVGGGSFQSMGE